MEQRTEYNIALTKEKNIPQRAVIGEILPDKKQFKCEIILNDALVAKYERKDLFVSLMPLRPLEIPQYKLILTAEFLNLLQKQDPTAFFKVYHELGHIHNHDLIRMAELSPEEREAKKNDETSAEEIAADKFAKGYMGWKHSLKALKDIAKERKDFSRGKEEDKAALRDIERRIAAIKEK